MKLLHKLLNSLVILSITATVSVYVLSGTLLNAHYLEASAESAHLYDAVSQILPASLAPGDTPEALVARQALSSTISTSYVKTKFNPFIEQILAHYTQGKPAPTLDVSDLAAEVSRQGLEVPSGSPLDKPITYQDSAGARSFFHMLAILKILAPLLALVLLAIVIFTNKGWQRFKAVAKICFGAAVAEGLVFVLFKFSPSLLDSLVKSKAGDNPLTPVLTGFFKSVLKGVANDFGIAALVLAALGIAVILMGLIFKASGFFHRHTGKDRNPSDRYGRPDSENRPTVN